MKRTILGFSLLGIPLFFAACSAGNEPAGEATSDTQFPEMAAASKGSEEARRLAQTLQSRLGLASSGELAARGVSVALSERANGAFQVREERSNVAIDVALLGATGAAREDVDGFAVYRAGHESGAHIVQRSGSNGAEDYLVFEKNLPKDPVLRYEVKLGDAIAGLRLVSRTLEFLDKAGTPQLRMAPPYAVDGDGKRIKLSVAVEDCAVDTSPLGPWRRPTVAPGRDRCIVRLEWEGAAKAPLIVDPVWIATEDLIEPRTNTAAAVLPNGLVLAAGGDLGTFGTEMDSAELYDPATNKWSATNSMSNARSRHSATAAQIDGAGGVFVAGGKIVTNGQAVYPLTTEFYNATTGEWSDKGVMNTARYDHVATRLADGRVLLSGGNSTGSTLGKCEVFDSGISAGFISMIRPRVHHTATLTTLGKVLLVGGEGAPESPATAETWDPVQAPTGPFSLINAPVPRPGGHAAVALPMGRVLVVGGYPMMAGLPPPGADIWTPGNMMPWTQTQPMQKNRAGLTLTAVAATKYLAVGGTDGGNPGSALSDVEVFEAKPPGQWLSTQSLIAARMGHEAVGLPGRQVLVIGGQQFPLADGVPNAEILAACDSNDDCAADEYCTADGGCVPKKAAGEPCNIQGECKDPNGCAQAVCASGHCADGVCCDTDCKGQCEACNGVLPGKCTAVIGDPVIGTLPVRMACPSKDISCGGKCGGTNRDACESFPIGNQCKLSCEVDKLQTYTCDGMGDCSVMTETTCGAYLCNKDKNGCQTSCQSQSEVTSCGEAYTCNDNGACVALPTKCSPDKPNEMLSETNEPISCGDYICRSSACLTACESAYDCYSETEPMVCTEGGVCKPFSEVKNEPSAGACGCSVPGGERPVRAQWLLMLAASSMLLRRRRSSRPLA